jgi:hypothetical protein
MDNPSKELFLSKPFALKKSDYTANGVSQGRVPEWLATLNPDAQ